MKTNEQKEADKKRKQLKIIHNELITAFQFKKIETWQDIFKKLGFTDQAIPEEYRPKLQNKPTYAELKEYLQKDAEALEEQLRHPVSLALECLQPQQPAKEVNLVVDVKADLQSTFGIKFEDKVNTKPKPAEEGFTSDNNYGLIDVPDEKAFLYWAQKKAIAEAMHKIVDEKRTGIAIIGQTGCGKTFIMAGLDKRLKHIGWFKDRTLSHIESLLVSRVSVVEQTKRVFKNFFNIKPNVDTEIINIEKLRAKAGEYWVRMNNKIINGQEVYEYVWYKGIHPPLFILDESQGAKNRTSTQSQIIYAYNNLPVGEGTLVCVSATPFARVSEAQAFAVSTHRPLSHLGFPPGTVLTNENWPMYASIISAPFKPTDFNKAAVDRLMDDLEPWVVRVKGIKPQFKAHNRVTLIPFENDTKRRYYEDAWERYLREIAKLEAEKMAGKNVGLSTLTALLKYQMAAEECHIEGFADRMHNQWKLGYAPVCAVKFKGTIIGIVKTLESKYGINRNQISLIWGGGQTALTEKQKTKAKVKELEKQAEQYGLSVDELLESLDLDEVEDRVLQDLPEHLRLGPQDMRERQREIDNFQSGKTQFCIFTFKSGGVGLSLHHCDELTTKWDETKPGYAQWREEIDEWNKHHKKKVEPGKCRRKESGYVFEQDIPFITVRPRKLTCSLTYNAMELVQALGRCPRLTSLSDTDQDVIGYAGTIEQDIGHIVSKKFVCLSAVVRMRESWQDVIVNPYQRAEVIRQIEERTANAEKDDETTIIDADSIIDEMNEEAEEITA